MYIGESRSVRSSEAIDNFEVPISFFCKNLIKRFELHAHEDDYLHYSKAIFNLPVKLWKFVAKHDCGPWSWHHTGKYFRKTYHYSMTETANYIQDNYQAVKKQYHQALNNQKNKKNNSTKVKLGVIEINLWGGSFRHPKFRGTTKIAGFIKDNRLIPYDDDHHYYMLNSNKIVNLYKFNSLKKFKKYVGRGIDLRKFKKFLRLNKVTVNRREPKRSKTQIEIDAMNRNEFKSNEDHVKWNFEPA